jgi:hypothetical protein
LFFPENISYWLSRNSVNFDPKSKIFANENSPAGRPPALKAAAHEGNSLKSLVLPGAKAKPGA